MLRNLVICCCLISVAASAADLPVGKVVLYKHGVGYFERSGELGAGESARLDFKASEMNDVLKSLTLETAGNDKVVALRYDASEPVSQRLARFPMTLQPHAPLSQLLDQFKGERIDLKFGAETVAGSILSARVIPGTNERSESEQITLLLDSGDIVARDLSAASSVRLADPSLQLRLKDYLAVLTGARSEENRSVYIDSTDSGSRRVSASYMIPTPVWKSSYRLIFGTSGQPELEGWAIVDNTTGDDWTKVDLALVSGRPISFVSQLYEPKYVNRPTADLPEEDAIVPTVHAAGIGGYAESEPQAAAGPALEELVMMAPGVVAPPPPPASKAALRRDMRSTVASTAQGRELGELFEYRFGSAVTVRKGESAMLPFLQQPIEARKLLIYSDQTSRHPLNAAELTNSTAKTLDGGPITVFAEGSYAGEALMETTKAGDKRLISYGIDLGTRVTTAFDSDRARIREIHMRRGVLTARSAMRETRNYTIRNVDQKPKTLIIEHPARPGYELLNQKPTEKTDNAYRFEVKLASGAEEKFPVTEERVLTNTYGISSQTPDFLFSFVENKELSQQAREQLGRILDKKREIAAVDAEIQRIETETRELSADQERLRQNISSLNKVSGQQEQVQRYATDLAAQESKIAGLRDSLSEARKRKQTLEGELNQLIESMEF